MNNNKKKTNTFRKIEELKIWYITTILYFLHLKAKVREKWLTQRDETFSSLMTEFKVSLITYHGR